MVHYKSGSKSNELKHLMEAPTDTEEIKIALRMLAENYNSKLFKTTRLCVVSLVHWHLDNPCDWSDFIDEFVFGKIKINSKEVTVAVELSESLSDYVHVFIADNFEFIGCGPVYEFDWVLPPQFLFRATEYHTYMETDESYSRIVSPTPEKWRRMMPEDVETVRKRWEGSDVTGRFLMPYYR